jgi:hypothetical protein
VVLMSKDRWKEDILNKKNYAGKYLKYPHQYLSSIAERNIPKLGSGTSVRGEVVGLDRGQPFRVLYAMQPRKDNGDLFYWMIWGAGKLSGSQ